MEKRNFRHFNDSITGQVFDLSFKLSDRSNRFKNLR